MKLFFNTRVGNNYNEGYMGVRTLILGASHYCPYNEFNDKYCCPNHSQCTTPEGTLRYNKECAWYAKNNRLDLYLEDESINELENYLEGYHYPTYNNFTRWLLADNCPKVKLSIEQREDIWSRFAFNNFVQYILPNKITPYFDEPQTQEIIQSFMCSLPSIPQLIIVWGKPVRNNLKRYLRLGDCLDDLGYNYETNIDGNHIVFCFLDHPSSPTFRSNNHEYLEIALKIARSHD